MKLTPIQRSILDEIRQKSKNNNQFHTLNRYNENTIKALKRRNLIEVKRDRSGIGLKFRITEPGIDTLTGVMNEYWETMKKQIKGSVS